MSAGGLHISHSLLNVALQSHTVVKVTVPWPGEGARPLGPGKRDTNREHQSSDQLWTDPDPVAACGTLTRENTVCDDGLRNRVRRCEDLPGIAPEQSLHQRKGQAPPPGKTRGPTSQQRRAPQRTGASHAREPCPAGHARLEHLQDQEPSPRRRRSASFPSHAPHRNWFREVLCLLTVRSSRAKWPPLMVSITSRERLCQPTFPRYDRAASILNRSTKAARRPPSHIRPR